MSAQLMLSAKPSLALLATAEKLYFYQFISNESIKNLRNFFKKSAFLSKKQGFEKNFHYIEIFFTRFSGNNS